MINLLPIKEKKKIRRDYVFRLLTIVLGAVSVSTIIGIVTLFPSYFISDFQKRAAVDQAERLKKIDGEGDQENIVRVLKEAQQKLDILSPEREKVFLRTIFDTAISYKPSTVILTGLVYQKENEDKARFIINGVADRREDLLVFSQNLERDALFDDVELPVSNLAQDRNINFTLTIIGMF